MKADLHCHTVLSDGAMRVDQIIPYAKRLGLAQPFVEVKQ